MANFEQLSGPAKPSGLSRNRAQNRNDSGKRDIFLLYFCLPAEGAYTCSSLGAKSFVMALCDGCILYCRKYILGKLSKKKLCLSGLKKTMGLKSKFHLAGGI